MTQNGVSPAVSGYSIVLCSTAISYYSQAIVYILFLLSLEPLLHKHVVASPGRTIRCLPSALADATHVAAAAAGVVGVHACGDPADAARVLGRRLGHPADGRVVPRERGGHGVVVCGSGGVSGGAGGAEDEAGGGGCGCADRFRPTLHQRLLHPQLHPPPSQPAHRRRRDWQDDCNLHNRLRRNARPHRLHGPGAPSTLPHLQTHQRKHHRQHHRLHPPHQHPPASTPRPTPKPRAHIPSLAAARRRANPPPRPWPAVRLRGPDACAAVPHAAGRRAASAPTAMGRIPNHPSRHGHILAPPAGGGGGLLHHLLRHAPTPLAHRSHLHPLPLPPCKGPAHPPPRTRHLPADTPPTDTPLPHRAPTALRNSSDILHLHALPRSLPQQPAPAARRRRHLCLPPRRLHRLPRPPHVRPAHNTPHPPPQHPPTLHHPRRRLPLWVPRALPRPRHRAGTLTRLWRAQPHARAGPPCGREHGG